jgi:O-antigen/teichoic acid export membrane protein
LRRRPSECSASTRALSLSLTSGGRNTRRFCGKHLIAAPADFSNPMRTTEIEILRVTEKAPEERIGHAAVARDVAIVGSGTLLAALFNVTLVFVIPRLVSVEDYGYWRLFMLYTGYAGFLHIGLPDGAFLRWAGRPLGDFRHEILPALRFLIWLHVAAILPAVLACEMLLRPDLRFVGVAVLVFSLLVNSITLIQIALQSARTFVPVAVSTAVPSGIFLALVFLWELRRVPDFRILIGVYFVAWSAALVYLLTQTKTRSDSPPAESPWRLGRGCVSLGWPILLANASLTVAQTADRLALSWAASVRDFAHYSLATSATVSVVLAVVVAAYRVFFPHLAALDSEHHGRIYATASRFLFLSWALLLPYYFVLELFVKRALPQYVDSLPIAYLLLPGTIFIGEILILHTTFAYVRGLQREFLCSALAALALSLLIAAGAAFGTDSLRVVAVGEVVALGLWWIFNEWWLREITGQTLKEWGPEMGLFCWATISYWLAFRQVHTLLARTTFYYGLIATALWLACPDELRLGARFLTLVRRRVAL